MFINCGFDLEFDVAAPTAMILALYLHPSRVQDIVSPVGPETIRISPNIPIIDYTDVYGNRVGRIMAPPGRLTMRHRVTVRDPGMLDIAIDGLPISPVESLPPEVLQFLLGSRYCEVDRFMSFAWNQFGQTPPDWQRVRAIMDFVHSHVTFGYQYARPTKTAWDVYQERTGVCRDFQHLTITLCRCMNVPARYVTGYLGDIAIPFDPNPMDFSAWMEVYLGGAWRTIDARHAKPRMGRVLMAVGRDATDVALTTSFGQSTLSKFHVVSDEVG